MPPETTAMSVEVVRERLFSNLKLPPDLLSKALKVTEAKLSAKVTKFFYHKGEITHRIQVDDNTTQLAASDQIYSIAGVYSRERDKVTNAPTVAFEVNPTTGVVRFIVGANLQNGGNYAAVEAEKPLSLVAANEGQLDLFTGVAPVHDGSQELEPEIEVVKFASAITTQEKVPVSKPERPKEIPEYIWNMLNKP